MSPTPSRSINRIPQIILLAAAAGLIIFLILLGTDTITLDSGPTMMISAGLFSIAMVATALEFGMNQTGIDNTPKTDE